MEDSYFSRTYRNIKKVYINLPLKQKLLFTFGVIIVFAVLIVGIFSYSIIKRYVYNQAKESYAQTLVQVKTNIEGRLKIYDEMAYQITLDKQLNYALSNKYTSDAEIAYEYYNTISRILEIRQKDSNILDAFILKNNQTLPEISGDLVPLFYSEDTWWYSRYIRPINDFESINQYIEMSKSKIWIVTREDIKPIYGISQKKNENIKIALYKPVIYNFERLTGVIALYLKYDSIFEGITLSDIDTDDFIFIADQKGDIIYDSRLGTEDSRSLPIEYLENIKEKSEGNFSPEQLKTDSIVLFTRGEDSDWVYFRQIPERIILAGAVTIRRFTIIIVLLSAILCFIIAAKLSDILTKRLTILSDTMNRVDNLELDIIADIQGEDEIGKLSQNYNNMVIKIKKLISQLENNHEILRESELKALQAQINPHFLYNTLATINWMAMDGNTDKIISMVDNLSIFYRLSLNKGKEWLPLKQEIEQIKAYIDIQKIRLDENISVTYDIQQNIEDSMILKLLLQPFVENSIIHGVGSKNGKLKIVIRAYLKDNDIFLEVIDDGVGMDCIPDSENYPESGGYGIKNVNDKIKLTYGNEFGVKLISEPGTGTTAVIRIAANKINTLPGK